jgi:hypothetical protein
MKPNKNDLAFVAACTCPDKRAELLNSLIIQRRISLITLYFFLLAYSADYFLNQGRTFALDQSTIILGAILVMMLVSKSDADTKIKILLLQK